MVNPFSDMIYVFRTTYLCGIRELKAPEMELLLHTTPEFKMKIVPGCNAMQMRGRGWE